MTFTNAFKGCLAVCLASSFGYATDIEKAIKNIEVDGFLRYRLTDTRFENFNFIKNNNMTGSASTYTAGNGAAHSFRANANFATPAYKGVAMNLGIMYNNNTTTNNGLYGTGLGAGEDGDFGVSTFYASLFLPFETRINAGKMRLDTPINDSLDDRGTGIYLTNTAAQGVKINAFALDTWSLDDGMMGLTNLPAGGASITKAFIGVGADADIQGFGARAWLMNINEVMNYDIYLNLSYTHPYFHLKAEYAKSQLQDSLFNTIDPTAPIFQDHSLLTLEGGVKFKPVGLRVGYITSGSDGYKVALDNQGTFQMAGQIWNDYSIADVNYSPLGTLPTTQKKLNVFYGSASLTFLENDALVIALDYVNGKNEDKTLHSTIKFQEITPTISYQYNAQLNLLLYYAMLSASLDQDVVATDYADATENRVRFQAIYKF
ncbi:hypothetical protein CCZ01_00310 [Helicobacter monodelphidis]|uniref:major outer membrane protein n=1 Tax=Helicobacter sp. 15-1451 TaxID=2004995 RepID=UPI000DCD9D62|nr:major outer membrane protein [Helicobacter sp. 15-1451]RAX59222.1 hypothetical protein CCZ01_00310 [Helicobacter sp. 15-1451]